MSGIKTGARAVADLIDGQVVASVDIAASPERVFQALASREVVEWWVNPGIFDTREWQGDVRIGGRWRASGLGRGQPYALEGEFLEIDPPRRLVHTWQGVGAPGTPSIVTYLLEPIDGGTRLTLRHTDIVAPDGGNGINLGWRTSFERLAEMLNGV
jgi:uncharacterized protein YndB with AHSA1/START domain